MELRPYLRKINYYETDQMCIVHHSNYIRYFEEARIDFMSQIGYDIVELEKQGVIIPVVDVYAKYHKSVRFGDEIKIDMKLISFTGARMEFEYKITFADSGELATTGHTSHCFVNEERKPISIKKTHPIIFELMKSLTEK